MELKAIGRELQRDQRFKLYINSQDASHLVQYIEDMGNIPSKAGETHCDSSSLDAAFRVQCMISEQLLPQLYPLECCTAATVTSDALGHSKPTESNSALFYSRPFNLSGWFYFLSYLLIIQMSKKKASCCFTSHSLASNAFHQWILCHGMTCTTPSSQTRRFFLL